MYSAVCSQMKLFTLLMTKPYIPPLAIDQPGQLYEKLKLLFRGEVLAATASILNSIVRFYYTGCRFYICKFLKVKCGNDFIVVISSEYCSTNAPCQYCDRQYHRNYEFFISPHVNFGSFLRMFLS